MSSPQEIYPNLQPEIMDLDYLDLWQEPTPETIPEQQVALASTLAPALEQAPTPIPEPRFNPEAMIGHLTYAEWSRTVIGQARRRGQSLHDAQDIAHILAARVLARKTATDIQAPVAYVATAVRHLLSDRAKKEERQETLLRATEGDNKDSVEAQIERRTIDPTMDPSRIVEGRDSLGSLDRHLQRLEAYTRRGAQALRLSAEGYTPAEIAAHFKISPNNASALLYRARLKVQKFIVEEEAQWEAEQKARQDRQERAARSERMRKRLYEATSRNGR